MSEANDEKCPDCGRLKAKNAGDAARGLCPKWWAIRDPMADRDCERVAALPSTHPKDETTEQERVAARAAIGGDGTGYQAKDSGND